MSGLQAGVRCLREVWPAFVRRAAAYLLLWMVVAGGDAVDVGPGVAAAILAAWASIRLMPPDPAGGSVRWLAALRLLGHFAWVSVLAGLDVARRAFSPRLGIAPGYAPYRPEMPPSDARSLFLAMTSQMPGTIPSGLQSPDTVAYHCLDAAQPVQRQLADEEARLRAVLGGTLGAASAGVPGRGAGA